MKKNQSLVIETKFSIVEYTIMVESIVDGFFGIDGEYQPHIGMANAMRLFYNSCVKHSKFDDEIPHNFTDIMLVDKLAEDDELMTAFNDALDDCRPFRFSFGNAFYNANDMIQTKKDSFANTIEMIKNALLSAIESIKNVMTQENIDAATQIAEEISSGKIDFGKIMEAYAGSPEFKRIVSSGKKDQGAAKKGNNVVKISPLKK